MKKPYPCSCYADNEDYFNALKRKFGSDVYVFWKLGKKFVGPEAEDFHSRYVQLLQKIRTDKEKYCDCKYSPK